MSPSTVELLRDILREAEFLSAQAGLTTGETFLHDEVLKRAFVRSVEVIGEATKTVPEETRSEVPAREWKKMAGMRDRLIHDYGGVDYQIVWDVAAKTTRDGHESTS
ncbi:MAG: HepT-like ribonuclease domain-containing protein [Verrucomicrobiota bacterium]|jgi:uncharacterized protein with HEPN domain